MVTGLKLRPYAGEDDVPELVRVMNAENEADGLDERDAVNGLRDWLSHPSEQFDPGRDLAEAGCTEDRPHD
ncbi:MAG: hypothetical protein ABIP01_05580 [Candidatus Limnocylindria bacterium]